MNLFRNVSPGFEISTLELSAKSGHSKNVDQICPQIFLFAQNFESKVSVKSKHSEILDQVLLNFCLNFEKRPPRFEICTIEWCWTKYTLKSPFLPKFRKMNSDLKSAPLYCAGCKFSVKAYYFGPNFPKS